MGMNFKKLKEQLEELHEYCVEMCHHDLLQWSDKTEAIENALPIIEKYEKIEKIVEDIQALSSVTPQEPFKPMVEIDLYSVIKQKYIEREVLDKIRTEIDKIYERENSSFDCLNALDELKEFIDKCKADK